MVGNRDMAELYQLVAAGGGRMVSSGDTAQLQLSPPGSRSVWYNSVAPSIRW